MTYAPGRYDLHRRAPQRTKPGAYEAALKSGAADEGVPAERTYFAPGYYAANVADFDGNRLEFVHKAWNSSRP